MQIEMSFRLPYVLQPEESWIVASCLVLDVHSQGTTEPEAVANLREAIQVFLETCIEMGTLVQVLKDSGFHVAESAEPPPFPPGTRILEVPLHLLGGGMPRITPVDSETLIRLFERLGFRRARVRGGHLAMTKSGLRRPLVIPLHGSIGPTIILSKDHWSQPGGVLEGDVTALTAG
jgi:predicted RNA binding protein YcfA (HicA-like mRNA interferase family)/predicted RNase H-like HicB family nuclease